MRRLENSVESDSTGKRAFTSGGAPGIARALVRVLLRIVLVVVGLPALAALTVAVLFAALNRTNGELVSSGENRRHLLFVPSTPMSF